MELLRLVCAKRVYHHRILNWSSVDRSTMKDMLIFGLKNSLSGMPGIIVLQTTAVCLASAAGPAALAVYARPLALVTHVGRLIHHYAALLTPVAGSLQGLKRDEELKEFLLSSLQSSFAMSIPGIIFIAGYGDIIVGAWMGQDYVIPSLAPILGVAFLLPFSHGAAMRILVGVNAHGRVAVKSLVVTAITLAVACTVAFSYGWSAQTAAIVTGVSMFTGQGIVVIVDACKRFHVSFAEYFSGALLKPMACNTFLLAVVLASRALNENLNLIEVMIWAGGGGVGVVLLYWKYLLDPAQQARLLRSVGARKLAASRVSED
jgi:O-antigen/teichoic acid export membrane protein